MSKTGHTRKRKNKPGAGAPTKLTPMLWRRIMRLYRQGALFQHEIAAMVHVHDSTLRDWIKNNPKFSMAIREAQAKGIDTNAANVQRAGKRQWQASAWWLERRQPERFARRTEVTGVGGGPVQYQQFNVEAEDDK